MPNEVNGQVVEGGEPQLPTNQTQEMVGIEILPIGPTATSCTGGVIRLCRARPDGEFSDKPEDALACGMSPQQLREVALRMLAIADGASHGTERTVVSVTPSAMWALPNQMLIVRYGPDLICEFVVKISGKLAAPVKGLVGFGKKKQKLILPRQ